VSPERREPGDLVASLRQRLRNLASERGADFRLILEKYGAERFLFRLGESAERGRFVLKGAMLFQLWAEQEFRATRDVDLLAHGQADHASIRHSIESICAVECPEDGVRFDPSTITVTDIRRDQEHGGVRVRLKAWLGTARIDLQVDVGSGDVVTPRPSTQEYPTLLGHPAPHVSTYSRETFIAEKFEAMIRLGPKNTRMKDFWDVAAMASYFDFEGETLRAAVVATLRRRRTAIPTSTPVALTADFYDDSGRGQQWNRFRAQAQPAGPAPDDLREAGALVRKFLGPVFRAAIDDEPLPERWIPTRGWRAQAVGKRGI
jgi:hypothetical protein